MNFLAHLALAGSNDASRIGNILGDFEKGTPSSIRQRLPDEVVAGIVMHRQIDRFTDDHPVFQQSKLLLAPHRRRFAGIIVDIFFDYFLNRHWNRYHPGNVPDFIEEIYQLFERRPEWLGQQFGPIVPLLRSENWLASYNTFEGLDLTLNRIATRSPKLIPIRDGVHDLREHQQKFEELFLTIYPDVRLKAAELLGSKFLKTPSFP